ncbi:MULTISPECIES: chlorophyllase/cutinase-like alpha/beta fold protein [Rhodococcus]|uniref:Dienelactone hydrolase family protein n=1 Tax=Rhodococcus oxybenzonivorans TaxID=1990687 RepID=A0AAE4UUQ9_9NOCA|nr:MULTISPECIES: dienelactone hydrolase family protein [Rhodococcus]MDV7245490.1 dienelactone hydrolase family protein [Rhodococcus oxybenzonivorans]MDV7263291.1 dienelactone hydrolase family protein [Rhodococcus oxybenzonivorans]MDV7276570.1 dienelactone hydrolase family protein [Rhodococcus oxybenzonivorans]MDV7336503.1 dienelactone hydrolase family protein [Rhodococcus oxybenzonivorans]MDV7346834.1 dienelactone hydrolase family protein [Rhodococcus oxybenzonivorans]
MAPKLKNLARELSKRGPHRVLRGDLALAGQPGVVYTPESGFNLPAVAFAHGWMTGADHYRNTLEHLASWGIVVAAPNSERGPVPSHLGLATDLRATLDICVGVRLGPGQISVQPDRVAFAGHGMGAGAAVLAAAQRDVTAVAALFPAPTAPKAEKYAPKITVPGLIVAGADIDTMNSNAKALAEAWGGDSVLRAVDGATDSGLTEGRRLLGALGIGGSERKTQQVTRALLTGFLLYELTNDKKYAAFADAEAHIPRTTVVDPQEINTDAGFQGLIPHI